MSGVEDGSEDRSQLIALVAATVAIPAVLVLRSALFGGDLVSIVLVDGLVAVWGAVVGLVALVTATRHAFMRRLKAASVAAAVAGVVMLAALNVMTVIRATNYTGAAVNLVMFWPWYSAQLPPKGSEPRLMVFDRGGLAVGGLAMVYDESDEIMLQPGRQSKTWKERAAESELACGYDATPLWGHYYDTWIGC